jgi:hypothetical protein
MDSTRQRLVSLSARRQLESMLHPTASLPGKCVSSIWRSTLAPQSPCATIGLPSAAMLGARRIDLAPRCGPRAARRTRLNATHGMMCRSVLTCRFHADAGLRHVRGSGRPRGYGRSAVARLAALGASVDAAAVCLGRGTREGPVFTTSPRERNRQNAVRAGDLVITETDEVIACGRLARRCAAVAQRVQVHKDGMQKRGVGGNSVAGSRICPARGRSVAHNRALGWFRCNLSVQAMARAVVYSTVS